MTIFVIEDEAHSEWCGEFSTFEGALNELKARAEISWDLKPNQCPCTNWQNCGRSYEIIEFDNMKKPWEEINRTPVLEISAKGVVWQGI
jgi:hypothetical protein